MRAKLITTQLSQTLWLRLAAILVFMAVTALAARVTIHLPFTPVPVTLQTLAVVLSGLVLGARGGAAAQLVYLGLIAAGLPFDANGLGPASFFGPTAGYLVGFVPAAFAAGWLAQLLPRRRWANFVAAVAGMLLIYLVGAGWLAVFLGDWRRAWSGGVLPFILPDLAKTLIAAGVAESGRFLFRS